MSGSGRVARAVRVLGAMFLDYTSAFIGFLVFIETFAWTTVYTFSGNEQDIPGGVMSALVLAEIAATIGGFTTVAAAVGKVTSPVRSQLVLVARLSIIATIAFVLLWLLLPVVKVLDAANVASYVVVIGLLLVLFVAPLAFSLAIAILVRALKDVGRELGESQPAQETAAVLRQPNP